MLVPTPGFMGKLASLCARHGILTVCDEVKVGLARTGNLHCFLHEDGFVPDIVALGKGLGGGLPLAALAAPSAILDHATAFAIQTLHGNPVSTAAGLAVLDTITAEKLDENAASVGGYFINRLMQLQARHPLIAEVRGRGLAIGIELDHAQAPRAAAQLVYRCAELGLVVYYVGVESNVIELTPPLIFSRQNVDQAIAIFDEALGDVAAGRFDVRKIDEFAGW
jgi:4-aminobutyrate aminotransferase